MGSNPHRFRRFFPTEAKSRRGTLRTLTGGKDTMASHTLLDARHRKEVQNQVFAHENPTEHPILDDQVIPEG